MNTVSIISRAFAVALLLMTTGVAGAVTYVPLDKSDRKIEAPTFEKLTDENHPRLFANDREFSSMKKKILKGDNEILCLLHSNIMELARDHGLSTQPLVYQKEASGKRILAVSREAITRIFTDAYAYRFYGDEKYLHHAEQDLNAVCDFNDCNPSHYLDCVFG